MEQIMEMLKTMQENADANRKADREQMLAIRQEMNANTKAFKEKTDTLVANIKTTCQEAMETSLKNMESNPEEKETVLEQHDIPNEEVAIHSQKTCRSESSA
jgi:2-hydroxy-3-keto-5-methylthiopentenyl-1-phosphate phosphatase